MREINNEVIITIGNSACNPLKAFFMYRESNPFSEDEINDINIIYNSIKMDYIDMYITDDTSEKIDKHIKSILKRAKIITTNFKMYELNQLLFLDLLEQSLNDFKEWLLLC